MHRYRIWLAVSAGLLIAVGGWLLTGRAESGAAAPNRRPLMNTTREKAFLAEELRKNPTHGPILLRLAQIERGEGDLAGARHHLEAAVSADGSQIEPRLELGLVLSEQGDPAGAEQQNRAILRIAPNQTDALYNMGAIAANRGELDQARTFWRLAAAAGESGESARKAQAALAQLGAKQ